ncbi:MAG TPA: hypothetical protein VIR78_14230 [Malonomonas sp.]
MKKYLFRSAAILLTFLLITLLCWFYAEQILNNFARPQLEKLTSEFLAAEVKIGQLGLTETGIAVHALRISSPGKMTVTVPRVELNFTLTELWNRQLAALTISNPQIELNQSTDAATPAETGLKIPEQLPLTIERLTVTNGQLLLQVANRHWQLQQINFSAALQQQAPFKLDARFGADENFPISASGTVEFLRQQSLVLESFSWQGQQLLATPLRANLAETGISLQRSTLQLKRFDHQQLLAILTALGKPSPLPENLGFAVNDSRITLALVEQKLQLELQVATGRVDWNDLRGNFYQLKLRLDRKQASWDIAGKLQGPANSSLDLAGKLSDEMRLTGTAQLRVPEPDQLKTELFAGAPLRIAGGLQLTADYALTDKRLQLTSNIQGFATEQQNRDYRLNLANLSGHGKLLLDTDKEDFSLALKLAAQPFLSVSGNFQQLNASLTLPQLQGLEELLPPGQVPEQLLAASGIKAGGRFARKASGWSGTLQLTADKIVLPALTSQALDCRGTLQLATDQLSFQQSTCRFGIAYHDTLTSQVAAEFAGKVSQQQFSLAIKQLSLAQLNYSSPDGQSGVGDAIITLQGEISGNQTQESIALNLSGNLRVKEVLSGTFYADLSAYSANFSLSGDWLPATLQLNVHPLTIALPQIGSLTTTGQLSPVQIQLQGHLELPDLATNYGEQLRPLLGDFRPAFADLNLAGGMSLETALYWHQNSWQTYGALQLRGLTADWKPQRLAMTAVTGSIPFALSSGVELSAATPATEYPGELSFAALSVSQASLEQGHLQLVATPNRLRFISPLRLQLAGGQAKIENLSLGWLADGLQGSAKIKITEVELETLTKELGLPVMQGRFSADLGTIHYADRQLKSDGVASIEVFDGRFQLQNMRYSNPFSRYPTFHTNIDFSGVDLLQATRTFDFGEMNGVLDGHIHGLEIFGKTPAAFTAAFSTRNEGKRNISVKALNNLSILSQGGISAALSRGIYKFIDFYRYRTIGIKCSLENDTFTLLGTAMPGSNRYLVQGGLLPPRIDITTSTPTISFKEMVNRLGRIERTGKSRSQGGQR